MKSYIKGLCGAIAIVGLAALNPSGGYAAQDSNPYRFLHVANEADSVVSMVPLTMQSAWRFDGGRMIVSGERGDVEIPLNSVSSVSHSAEALSQYSVRVHAESKGEEGLEGIVVMLTGLETDDYYGIVQLTDADGVATFGNLPYGTYNCYVRDPREVFYAGMLEGADHVFADGFSIYLMENVLTAQSLEYEALPKSSGLYAVDIRWLMGPENLYGPFRDYLFDLYLDGNWIGMTSETNFMIEDLAPGDYILSIGSTSGYGNPSSAYASLPLHLEEIIIEEPEDDIITGVGLIEGEGDVEWRYFDLRGLPVNPERAAPGIYLRSNGVKVEKVRL